MATREDVISTWNVTYGSNEGVMERKNAQGIYPSMYLVRAISIFKKPNQSPGVFLCTLCKKTIHAAMCNRGSYFDVAIVKCGMLHESHSVPVHHESQCTSTP